MSNLAYIPASLLLEDIGVWPSDLLEIDGGMSVLDRVGLRDTGIRESESQLTARFTLVFEDELVFALPGLAEISLVIGSAGGRSEFTIEADLREPFEVRLIDISAALRFSPNILKPVRQTGARFEADDTASHVEIRISGTIAIGSEGLRVEGLNQFILPPAMIGSSGVIIEANQIALDLDRDSSIPEAEAAGLPASWTGVVIQEAIIHLPPEMSSLLPDELKFENCFIGSGGFSGRVEANWDPAIVGDLAGVELTLQSFGLEFRQNSLVRSEIAGRMSLPFFKAPLDVEIGLDLDGGFSIKLASDTGISTLTIADVVEVEIESLGLELDEGLLTARMSGSLKPLFQSALIDWPSLKIKELAIDSNGNVHLEGGWLDLPEQYSLDLYGFQIDIIRLGLGKTEDGGKWIGFSGGVKLVDGLTAGASVEGLRIIWYDGDDDERETKITLNGIGVEFEVPDVVRFKGAISYNELEVTNDEGETEIVHRFDGDIKLELTALDLEIDGTLVVGSAQGTEGSYNFFAIYLGVELPAGIPLWATGLGLYGVAGLFANQMEPNKQQDEAWYSIDTDKSWYHRGTPGVTDLKQKWINRRGSMAFGAGLTVGTITDNGFILSSRAVLVIAFPGPIIMIEGRANLLRERASLNDEPMFRSLAVIDQREGSFLFGLDARYAFGNDGELIDIRAGAEAFFSLSDPGAWHIYIGEREPRDRRIRASIFFHLFEANAYFMLDARQLAMGAWVGYSLEWNFGPVSAEFEAWVEGNVIASWKPVHLHGDYWVHGRAGLSVFGFGFSFGIDVRLAADVFDPFHLLAEIEFVLGLPWPIEDIRVPLKLEWGPEPIPPLLPEPLKEIAIEHLKVTTNWPLPRGEWLLPVFDVDGDGYLDDSDRDGVPNLSSGNTEPANFEAVPVVPLDCRPRITFGRSVHDDADVGMNPQPIAPEWEFIGDPARNEGPARVRYGLKEVALHKRAHETDAWELVARSPSQQDSQKLYGSWAPIPAMPDGGGTAVSQVKLWLWSKSAFDFTRYSLAAWDEWFTDRFVEYPCIPPATDTTFCCDFEEIDSSYQFPSPWQSPQEKAFVFSWGAPALQSVTVLGQPIDGLTHALCFPSHTPSDPPVRNIITIQLPEPARRAHLTLRDEEQVQAFGFDAQGQAVGPFVGGTQNNPHIEVNGQNLVRITLRASSRMCLVKICATIAPSLAEVAMREEMAQHFRDEMAHWYQKDNVLEPNRMYQLTVVTSLRVEGAGELLGYKLPANSPPPLPGDPPPTFDQTHFAYFRTEGPPGLTHLTPPAGSAQPEEFDSGLNDLARYVRQTVPPTVPPAGEPPLLPRPVYRAYDVGVEFNENYVDLMYKISRRDLGLYLYDNNNRPVRDAAGRLIALSNRWGEAEELTLTESEYTHIKTVNSNTCAELLVENIARHVNLNSQGHVLDADSVYEARLVPLLLHEAFASFEVGDILNGPSSAMQGWIVADDGNQGNPSNWEIREEGSPPARYIRQTSDTGGGSANGADPVKPGAVMRWGGSPSLEPAHPENPLKWSDYRVSVYLRATDEYAIDAHAMGLIFRYADSDSFYRFSMDRELKYRRLVRVVNGAHTILKEDDFVYQKNVNYLITVEALGSSLRVYQDGHLIFDAVDEAIPNGSVALYCSNNPGTRFSDLRVDDFRAEAPAVYRFNFTTSQYANFYHHLHSFQDETWRGSLEVAPDRSLATTLNNIAARTSEPEARAYEELADTVLGQAARQSVAEVEVTRVRAAGAVDDSEAMALLARSPEPIDWSRVGLDLLRAEPDDLFASPPGAVKLTEATFGESQPNQESVTLLLRETTNLNGCSIQHRKMPGALAEITDSAVMFADEFEDTGRGLLFAETFGPNALDHYEIINAPAFLGGSQWAVANGHIIEPSGIFGQAVAGLGDKPGTMAVTGSPLWSDVRISATLRSEDYGSIGVVMRYRDGNHYYRLSMNRSSQNPPLAGQNYLRLIKQSRFAVRTLWEDAFEFALGASYRLVIEIFGDRLLGYLNDALIFIVRDSENPILNGRAGFYCSRNPGAHFEALKIESLEADPIVWQPALEDLSEIEIRDETGAVFGPSQWQAAAGVLTQSSNIHVVDNTYHLPGTYAIGGQSNWRDAEISVLLGSDDGDAIGVMFRYQDSGNYYRFSMDQQRPYRRLVKVLNGVATLLWEDSLRYSVGKMHNLTLRAIGTELTGYLDGAQMFQVSDDDLRRGRVALYCWADFGARFERLVVLDRTRRLGPWVIYDDPNTLSSPSVWKTSNDALQQTSAINGYAQPPGNLRVGDPLGTYAVAGDPTWTDYRLIARMRSDDNYAIGVVVRYTDETNFYRLSFDVNAPYRRLIKRENGELGELWFLIGNSYTLGEPFTMTVDALGSRIVGYLGDTRLFDQTDTAHSRGQIGLYCYANEGARFERVEVRRLPREAYALLRDRFLDGDLAGWNEENDGNRGRASWAVTDGELRQTGDIHTPNAAGDTISYLGTQRVAGDPGWTDFILTARLSSPAGGQIGLMIRYADSHNYYRFSINNHTGARMLAKNRGGRLSLLWSEAVGYDPGRAYEVAISATGSILRGYIDGVLMFVIEDTDLAAGRIGLYCSANQDARFSQVRVYPATFAHADWLLDEPFDLMTRGRWTFINEQPPFTRPPFGELIPVGQSSAHWEVTGGEMRQTGDYYEGSIDAAAIEKPGTYAIAGDPAWTDYRLSVRLRSDSDNAIGVVFRHKDRDNYYRFSMDEQLGYRRLVKKVGGAFSLLWESSQGYDTQREHLLTIDCVGDRLTGYLNGVQLFALQDDDLAEGRIGLYSWRNNGARFTEVRVASPLWVPLYTFESEEPLPAGARLRVFSGRRNDPYQDEPGVATRFAASLGERGDLSFNAERADLRIAGPDGSVMHQRAFLPANHYSTVADVMALRKADGTGFFLIKRDGSAFEAGLYRMEITYRRNNWSQDQQSQMQSEAGNSEPEVVKMDIP